MSVTLSYHHEVAALPRKPTSHLFVLGRASQLASVRVRELLPTQARDLWDFMIEKTKPGDHGKVASTWTNEGDTPYRVLMGVLPEVSSRHNAPARPHAITSLLRDNAPSDGDVRIVLALERGEHALAAACAVARAFPIYDRKTKADDNDAVRADVAGTRVRSVDVAFVAGEGALADLDAVAETAYGVRLAAKLVDTPTSELHTDALVDQARQVAAQLGVPVDVIAGEALRDQSFGGLWGVGKAAVHKPALVVLKHEPHAAKRCVAWVGKGIVYDTGGLSLKSTEHMTGMKSDMGGAAAVLGAFTAAVRAGFPDRLYAVLCLAENAIGPEATRPDDILTLYSGKTVEVNNTDAEGRLVLGDGVAYAVQRLHADIVVDVATLTGAQMIATGKRHAAIVCNDEALEQAAVAAGRLCGDLVHPLPYCPELLRAEFKSDVADMKNSVKDRLNAQSSCAAQFVAEHLGEQFAGKWLHIDIAGPSTDEHRGTGFGVALLASLIYP